MNPKDWKHQAVHYDKKGPFAPFPRLLRATGFRYPYVLKDLIIGRTLKSLSLKAGSRILDIGCGSGILLDRLGAIAPVTGFGVDVSRASLKRARRDCVRPVEMVAADGRRLPFADNTFHGSLSMDTLEHVEAPEKMIEELVRVTAPSGSIVCYAVSARNRWTFNWILMSLYDWMGLDHWSWAAHDPELLVDPENTNKTLVDAGCKIDRFEPFHAFFTIMLDNVILASLWAASHLDRFKAVRKNEHIIGRWLLALTSVLSRVMMSPLRKMDAPWVRRGLSNGFLVVATKVQTPKTGSIANGFFNPLEVSPEIDSSSVASIGRRT